MSWVKGYVGGINVYNHLLLIPASGPMMSIGQEMMMKHSMNAPQTPLVKNEPSDTKLVKAIKRSICQMTEFDSKKRGSMQQVMQFLQQGKGESNW